MSASFAGRVIEGEITMGTEAKEQHAESEFTEALDKLLNIEGVEAVRWTQYTPYFNDGEPCVFDANDSRVKLADGDEEGGDYGDGFLGYYELEEGELRNTVKELDKLLNGGHHDILLVSKFGDHAEVTATKEKFIVESYEHD